MNLIILQQNNLVVAKFDCPVLTPPPDFVLEVPDETVVEVGWTYVPGDTPESYSFIPPEVIEE